MHLAASPVCRPPIDQTAAAAYHSKIILGSGAVNRSNFFSAHQYRRQPHKHSRSVGEEDCRVFVLDMAVATVYSSGEAPMDIDEDSSPPTIEETDLTSRLDNTHITSDEDEPIMQPDNDGQEEDANEGISPLSSDAVWSQNISSSHPTLRNRKAQSKSMTGELTPQSLISDDATNSTNTTPRMDASMPAPWPHSPKLTTAKHPVLFTQSSSGQMMIPTIESSSFDEDPDQEMCPASRAAAATEVLAAADHSNMVDTTEDVVAELQIEDYEERLSRQETMHTSNHSGLNLLGGARSSGSSLHSTLSSPSQNNNFNNFAPASPGPNPDLFPSYNDTAVKNKPSNLYTFSSNSYSGRILTLLSDKFVPVHQHNTHGGSALAGFLALLLVTCANYMLGPMRDAAALAVGVSHIPALTLASTVLALGSSVPVGWLFEAPDPRRRRVWKRMGLTRGETQGSSLALFYRVFAFLLLSYAIGFQFVDKFGRRNGKGEEVVGSEDEGEDSIIAWISIIFFRVLAAIGIPVDMILAKLEELAGDLFGIHRFMASSLVSHQDESIPALILHACSCVVNKFGSIIYIMFFLVVHLMKLHSLSLIWGVTTEAMEYEENAEQRRAAKEKEDLVRTTSAGGLVMTGSPNKRDKSNDCNNSQVSSKDGSSKPSKSSLRLKRLGFVGFGGTLGGILGR